MFISDNFWPYSGGAAGTTAILMREAVAENPGTDKVTASFKQRWSYCPTKKGPLVLFSDKQNVYSVCPCSLFIKGFPCEKLPKILHQVLSGVSCSMARPLHCQNRWLWDFRAADRTVILDILLFKKSFLLMEYIIISFPKKRHQHKGKDAVFTDTGMGLLTNVQEIACCPFCLWCLGNISSAWEKRAKMQLGKPESHLTHCWSSSHLA